MSLLDASAIPASPAAEMLFRRPVRVGSALRGSWEARGLIRSLSERSLRVRYKRAYLGVTWAVLGPIGLLVALTFVFDRAAGVDSEGVPYALYAYIGLLPWTFTASAAANSASSILNDKPLLNKVYFPREVLPLSSVTVAAVDALIAGTVLLGLFAYEGFMPRATALLAPLLLIIALVFVIGIALLLSALTVYVRDIRLGLPLALQIGLFVTPVGYSFSLIPEGVQLPYAFFNPIAVVIDALRRTVLLGTLPDPATLAVATLSAVLTLALGYTLFKRLETGFADIA